MSDRFEEVKSIGDAGDSTPICADVQDAKDNTVCDMVRCIHHAIHCGDHQSLKMALEKLELWKEQEDDSSFHDYWRVAQLTGETELKSLSILLTVTSEKPENVRWLYLQDVLSVLAVCLSNREIIFLMLVYVRNLQPVLTMALNQDQNVQVCHTALNIVNRMLIVCGIRFAKFMLNNSFLDGLVIRIGEVAEKSPQLFKMILEVIKSIFICGHDCSQIYASQVLDKINAAMGDNEQDKNADGQNQSYLSQDVLDLLEELTHSVAEDPSPQECALYWMKGKSRKDLLCASLDQPWLRLYCSWSQCGVHNGMAQTFFRKCGACSVTRYCSRQCQTKHWEAGHNLTCKIISHRSNLAQVE